MATKKLRYVRCPVCRGKVIFTNLAFSEQSFGKVKMYCPDCEVEFSGEFQEEIITHPITKSQDYEVNVLGELNQNRRW